MNDPAPGDIVAIRHKFPPVGECIYCGRGAHAFPPLTEEHIIPFGLNGLMTLPYSSCVNCNDVTKRFEQSVLREMLSQHRVHLDMRTRRKKDRPKELPILVQKHGWVVQETVPVAQHPFVLTMPDFAPAALLEGRPIRDNPGMHLTRIAYRDIHKDGAIRAANLGGTSFGKVNIDWVAFARMLAKIAHSFAVARYGLRRFEMILPGFIHDRVQTTPMLSVALMT